MSVAATHPHVVVAAARGYLAQLRAVEPEVTPEGQLGRAVRHLIDLHEAALARGSDLEPRDVEFRRSDLADLDAWQLAALLDQHGLGIGSDGAPIILMGTEEAYDVTNGGDLTLACCLTALWLCGSRPSILDAIDPTVIGNARTSHPRPYHLHPNDYYRVDLSRGRSTWACIAQVLAPDDPASLLAPPSPGDSGLGLGDVCYQIDVSAAPSKQASGGHSPHATRIRFLCQLVSSFTSASALVFHGGPSDDARQQLASAFLGRPVRWSANSSPREWLAWDASDGRAVFHSYALNGRVRRDYLNQVRAKLYELAPSALPT